MAQNIYCLRNKIALIVIPIFLIVFQSFTFAQSGSVKGVVYDKSLKESLTGANVILQGTSLGAATDLDGNFTIRNIPVGSYKMVVSYIGYNPVTIDVTITANRTLEQDFYLDAKTIEGETITITAQAQGQVSAIQQQLTSDKIVSVVSEARIQELPDFNAAQAISRLPGVSTLESSGEANKVVIRGLAPQYNQISIGGISMASTGSSQIGVASQGGTSGSVSNDRSVDLSMVSPYMIKTIAVYKSLTPDMNANSIGGTVNMSLREAPSGLRTDVLWQSGYTDKSKKYSNYRAVASVSNRFFDDVFGVYVLGNIEQYDRDADNMDASYTTESSIIQENGYRNVQVTGVTLNRHIETRSRYGGNLIMDYKFDGGIIRSINMLSRLTSDYQDYNTILNHKDHHLDFRYREGENSTDVGMSSLQYETDLGFMTIDLKAAYTFSQNNLPRSPFYQFRQTGGVGTGAVPVNTIPEDLISSVNYRGPSELYLSSISLFDSKYKEQGQLVKADFAVPVNFAEAISGSFKFGGEYRLNRHTNDQSTPFAEIERTSAFKRQMMDSIIAKYPNLTYDQSAGKFSGTNFTSDNEDLYKSFLDNNFGQMYWIANAGVLNSITDYIKDEEVFNAVYSDATNPGGWYNSLFQQLPNDYDYRERYSAFYGMGNFNVSQKLTVVGGIRFEDVSADYRAYNLLDGRNASTQTAKEVTVHPKSSFWLPMVQAKYDATNWMDIRYSYTQTLARPAYHQLSPHYSISYDRGSVRAGNPNLKPARSLNHDFMITLHDNYLGLLSLGAFYKEIENFTFSTSYKLRSFAIPGFDSLGTYSDLGSPPKDGAVLYTYMNNKDKAYVRGLEADFQTRFWYLPFPLDGLLIGVNYTHIQSKAFYPVRDEITYGIPGRPGYRVEQIDTTRSGRLIYQPNDILNLFIGYDYKDFSAKVSFVFQGNSSSYIGTLPESDGFTKDYYRVDVSVRQKLPWEGFQVFLDVNNLNNRMNMSAQQSIGGFTNQKHYGLTANLGVRFSYSGM